MWGLLGDLTLILGENCDVGFTGDLTPIFSSFCYVSWTGRMRDLFLRKVSWGSPHGNKKTKNGFVKTTVIGPILMIFDIFSDTKTTFSDTFLR